MRQLTEAELEQSATGPTFANVTAVELFGPRSSYELASRVQRLNPARYAALRLEFEYLDGSLVRPDSYYQ